MEDIFVGVAGEEEPKVNKKGGAGIGGGGEALEEVRVVVERGGVPKEKVGRTEMAGEPKSKEALLCGACGVRVRVERGGVPKLKVGVVAGWLEVGELKERVWVSQVGAVGGGTGAAARGVVVKEVGGWVRTPWDG